MEDNPLVSVLMTAYNREQYIAEAIESVLISSYANFELIVVDDCSTDNTLRIIKDFEGNDGRIKVHVNEANLGDYGNRNKAASYASGEYLMHVDSDDKILVDGIENCVKAMAKFTDANFGMYSFIDRKEPFELKAADIFHEHFFRKPFLTIGPGGTIIRRDFFKSIQGYPEKYGPANDMYFNLKACTYSNLILLPFEFIYYRRHEGQQQNNITSYLHNNYSYFKDALNELNIPIKPSERNSLLKKNNRRFVVNILKYIFKTRNMKEAKDIIKKADFKLVDALTGIFH